MNFVYENMSLDDWRKLKSLEPIGMYPAGIQSYWVVDHENDIQLVSLGGQGSAPEGSDLMPDFYIMVWQGKVIRFESRYTSQFVNDKESIKQHVFSIWAPKGLNAHSKDILKAIPIALEIDWLGLKRNSRIKLDKLEVRLETINYAK